MLKREHGKERKGGAPFSDPTFHKVQPKTWANHGLCNVTSLAGFRTMVKNKPSCTFSLGRESSHDGTPGHDSCAYSGEGPRQSIVKNLWERAHCKIFFGSLWQAAKWRFGSQISDEGFLKFDVYCYFEQVFLVTSSKVKYSRFLISERFLMFSVYCFFKQVSSSIGSSDKQHCEVLIKIPDFWKVLDVQCLLLLRTSFQIKTI